ncbi:MAG: DUF4412 domain-containing protein [Syntrophobacteraceae bacterium]
MKAKLWRIVLVALFAAGCSGPASVKADVFMKEKHHTDGMTIMGQTQPAKDIISTTWISKDKMRRDQDESSSITTTVNGKLVVYQLNHTNKTYAELTTDLDGAEDPAMSMAGKMKVKITPTSETKKIGNWNCRKYIQEVDMGMMPMTTEIWASEDIKTPYADFYEKLASSMTGAQSSMGMMSKAMMEENKKIKGVPVLTVTNMTMMQNVNVKSSTELLEIKEITAPAGTFDIPSDYTKQDMMGGYGSHRMPAKPRTGR